MVCKINPTLPNRTTILIYTCIYIPFRLESFYVVKSQINKSVVYVMTVKVKEESLGSSTRASVTHSI